jgi:hypothetical protein
VSNFEEWDVIARSSGDLAPLLSHLWPTDDKLDPAPHYQGASDLICGWVECNVDGGVIAELGMHAQVPYMIDLAFLEYHHARLGIDF